MLEVMDKEMLELFFEDTIEMLDSCIDKIIEIEGNFDNEAMDEILRTMHSIKGASSMIDLYEIENYSHNLEDLFINIKEENYCIENELIEVVLESLNLVKKRLEYRKEMFSGNFIDFNKELEDEKKEFYESIDKIKNMLGKGRENSDNNSLKNSDNKTCKPLILSTNNENKLENNMKKAEKIGEIKRYSYKIEVFFDETADMFELKRIILKNNFESIGAIKKSDPTEDDIFTNEVNYYKIVLQSEKKYEDFLDTFDIGDIYLFSIEEMENINSIENISNKQLYLKKELYYNTVESYYNKISAYMSSIKPKKVNILTNKKDIYGEQFIYMLKNEDIAIG